jgi:[acyl-carrier-protein] S-malonyltransferase
MGRGLVEAAPTVFSTASDVLDVDVAELCLEGRSGSADLLTTRWAQPAVLVCSVAAFDALSGRESFAAVAGHSVGEYAALVASQALELSDALVLIRERADATDDAGRASPGGMAAVMRIEKDALESLCAEHGAALAADNGPGQFVVSGPIEALERTVEAATSAGAVCRRLEVAAAFHSPVMAAAAERLAAALDGVTFSTPTIELWSSTAAAPVSTAEQIRTALLDQLTSPVRWRQTIEGLAARLGAAFSDLGPGRVVAGLTKRIVKGAQIRTLDDLLVSAGGAS